MPAMAKPVMVLYAYIDGVHFFTSPEVKGLCAGSADLRTAYHEATLQLSELLSDKCGHPVVCEPETPLEEFERWLEAQLGISATTLESAAMATWKLAQSGSRLRQ
jgi:hypothetical protein